MFLENVPNILKLGMQTLLLELVKKRGFTLRWCLFSACEVGAPHRRKGWYCIANRSPITSIKFPKSNKFEWTKEPHRMLLHPEKKHCIRHYLLGNAVVSYAARKAYEYLLTQDNNTNTEVFEIPKHGYATKTKSGNIHVFSIQKKDSKCRTLNLVLDPKIYTSTKPPHSFLATDLVKTSIKINRWGTPTSSTLGPANYLTERSKIPLHTQVRFELSTPNALRKGRVSPEFVEWMMGYPIGWTRFE